MRPAWTGEYLLDTQEYFIVGVFPVKAGSNERPEIERQVLTEGELAA
jgi:hypothetical protein